MPDATSTREMLEALRGIGFVEASRHGSHLMLRHQKTGLLVTLPTDRAYVPLVYMRAILQQLINYRIETPEELRRVFHILEPSL